MHEPYEKRFKHIADFRVKYRFYTKEEGGRTIVPFQGYRSDFWYEHKATPQIPESSLFMIHPEFENELGEIITNDANSVPAVGTARMWILDPSMRPYHYDKIINGLKCNFMEGPKRVAECEVIEILGLLTNPHISKIR
jgi:hypothetical protein